MVLAGQDCNLKSNKLLKLLNKFSGEERIMFAPEMDYKYQIQLKELACLLPLPSVIVALPYSKLLLVYSA